ncbi:restriction endonuclease subunit S [Haemophilus influenzae]|uniref:restriction endonuclease subunit S n=1 Tax=Haemophilus influenzae TaxID=727 RepID=UPI0010C274D9|nr:restriction endonuclease subunit S [Haemophilus influenzae]VTP73321.1 putative type I restriction-modification system, specificity determinant; restriction endonuclease [Haemophilus influenzae]
MKNNRTFLEKLLDGAEVEWKPLWSVTTWDKRFNAVEKEKQPKVIKYHYYLASELKPLIVDGGNVKLLTTNESDIWTTEELVQSNISEGEIIAIPWGGNPIVQYYKGKFVTADNRIATSNNTKILDNKFLYYFLLSKLDVISSFYRGSGIKHPSMYHVLEMLIPIPPLSVQIEIVKILDALTALTSELTSELILRQKQYEYYREKLLSEEELGKVGFEWKPLGEVTNIKTGQAVSKYSISQNPGIYPVINSGREPLGFINEWNTENDPIGITTRGAGVGSITWQEGKYFRGNLNYSVTVKSDYKLNVRFLYHILLYFQKEIHNLCSFTGIPALNASELKKLEISIPAIEEQQRIVSILDKFEDLTNSITDGLPLAIEQSQKRYEYYRELLLSFS